MTVRAMEMVNFASFIYADLGVCYSTIFMTPCSAVMMLQGHTLYLQAELRGLRLPGDTIFTSDQKQSSFPGKWTLSGWQSSPENRYVVSTSLFPIQTSRESTWRF